MLRIFALMALLSLCASALPPDPNNTADSNRKFSLSCVTQYVWPTSFVSGPAVTAYEKYDRRAVRLQLGRRFKGLPHVRDPCLLPHRRRHRSSPARPGDREGVWGVVSLTPILPSTTRHKTSTDLVPLIRRTGGIGDPVAVYGLGRELAVL